MMDIESRGNNRAIRGLRGLHESEHDRISTSLPRRTRLANRRPVITETLLVGGQSIQASVGFDPATGQPHELFLSAGKTGSALDALLADAAVAISVALQHGIPAAALAKSIGRLPCGVVPPGGLDGASAETSPASAIGAALDLVASLWGR